MLPMSDTQPVKSQRVTLSTVRKWARDGERFAMLTCYDATTAKWLVRGGVRCLLVGDTAAQFILGHDSTLPVPLAFMIEITKAVRRGAPDAFVMADMPFGSYQCGDDNAMANAVRVMAETGADVVKFEMDDTFLPLVRRLSSAGVPVVAHLGSRPQLKLMQGRYRKIYHDEKEVGELVDTARRMADHGAVLLLLEAVPQEVSQRVVEAVSVPVIGCGAGAACHGHVVVLHDLLGMTDWHAPFAPPMADIGPRIQEAAARWDKLVREGNYLKSDHPYHFNR
jgi:3-methyl-2-oxobutanoate hydroxymethyltransferase